MVTEKKTGQEDASERLHEAIDGLRKDVTRVEIWATALYTFTQPVPEYRADPRFELGQPVKTDPLAEKFDPEPAKSADGKAPK
jgi:hypothetical protein